jgi:hypothetical protein
MFIMSLLGFAKRQVGRATGLVESALIEAENTARVAGILPPRSKRRTRAERRRAYCPGVYYRDGDGKTVGPVIRCCLGEPEGDEGVPGAEQEGDQGGL